MANSDVYLIDELGKLPMSNSVKDRLVELMEDPSKIVIATAPKHGVEPDFDKDFVNYIKGMSQVRYEFNKPS